MGIKAISWKLIAALTASALVIATTVIVFATGGDERVPQTTENGKTETQQSAKTNQDDITVNQQDVDIPASDIVMPVTQIPETPLPT